jgi:Immunoglobulin domain
MTTHDVLNYFTQLINYTFIHATCIQTLLTSATSCDNRAAIQVSGTDYVEEGAQIQLMCNATGRPDPPHNVDWYKGGVKIASDAQNGVIITKKIETKVLVSMLVIKRSRESDGGDYECRSSNNESGSVTVRILAGMYN